MEDKLYIKTLTFDEYGYGFPPETYSYTFKDGKAHISYSFSFCKFGVSPNINVKDPDKFSTYILKIIKSWKKDNYYWDYKILDGTCWNLNIKISNGKYLKFIGHEKYPEN